MVLYGVVPECHRSVSGMVSECIMSAKMVSLSASGTVTDVVQTFSWLFGAHDHPLTRQRIFTVNR